MRKVVEITGKQKKEIEVLLALEGVKKADFSRPDCQWIADCPHPKSSGQVVFYRQTGEVRVPCIKHVSWYLDTSKVNWEFLCELENE